MLTKEENRRALVVLGALLAVISNCRNEATGEWRTSTLQPLSFPLLTASS
jgi:hypothetical protein